jgi:DNA ligase (NAD+)
MKNDSIKKDYLKKIQLFQKYNKHYYDKDKPTASDQKFDILKKDIINLESKHKFLKSEFSPTKST